MERGYRLASEARFPFAKIKAHRPTESFLELATSPDRMLRFRPRVLLKPLESIRTVRGRPDFSRDHLVSILPFRTNLRDDSTLNRNSFFNLRSIDREDVYPIVVFWRSLDDPTVNVFSRWALQDDGVEVGV